MCVYENIYTYVYIHTHAHVKLDIPRFLQELLAQAYNFICNYSPLSLMLMYHQQSIRDLYSCIFLNKLYRKAMLHASEFSHRQCS